MSPDRGEGPSLSNPQRDSSPATKRRADSGYDASIMEEEQNSANGDPITTLSEQSAPCTHQESNVRNPRSENEPPASVRSLSSVPSSKSSRRDSAISSSSQPRQRTKPSRSISHQGSLYRSTSKPSSIAGRPHPRRMTSSPHIQGRGNNIEETLAFHQRSCQIFGTAVRPTTSNGVPTTTIAERPKKLTRRATTAEMPLMRDVTAPAGPVRAHTAQGSSTIITEEEPQYENYVPATIIHWTSPETRRKEYTKIDKSNKGVRGLLKKLFPKLASRSSESRFYDEKEGSNAGSIRRFRLDLPDEEDEDDKKS
jgi:hypothetical protein